MAAEKSPALNELERVLTGYLEQEGPLKTALVIARCMRKEGFEPEITWKADGNFIVTPKGKIPSES
jgi:hypothetical protein